MVKALDLGVQLLKRGDLYKAKEIFEEILLREENNYVILNLLGVTNLKLKKYSEAISLIEKAIDLDSNNYHLYNNLAIIYKELGENDESIKNLEIAIKINPNYAEAYNNLGIIFKKKSQFEKSLNSYKKAIKLKPYYFEAYNNLGLLYLDLSDFKNAIDNFNKAIEINQKYSEAYQNRGVAYSLVGKYIQSNKDFEELKVLDTSKSFFCEANILFNKAAICDWQDYEVLREKFLQNLNSETTPLKLLNILYFIDKSETIKNYTNNFNKDFDISKKININLKKKIILGYYSSDFKKNVISYLIAGLLEKHNKNIFEIIGFHFNRSADDEMTTRISNTFNKFLDLRFTSDEDIIYQSKKMKIDIAIDLNGFTYNNRKNIFLKRVAPLQINFLGWPGTFGSSMDYIIADKNLIPKESQKFYFEKIIYLPDCYLPYDDNKKINNLHSKSSYNLPLDKFLYCNLNNPNKITPKIFNCWMQILNKTSNTTLCLLESNKNQKDNIILACKNKNIDPSRIIFLPKIPYEDSIERYKFFDLFLDTFPYAAGAVASDALSNGLPVITLCGEQYHSRMSASLLKSLSLDYLVMENIEEYENFAISMNVNKIKLNKIKEQLLSSTKISNTFKTNIFTENLEKAYKKIYERYNQNLNSENIYI